MSPWSGLLFGEFRIAPLRTLLAMGAGRRIVVGRRFRIRHAANIRGRLSAGIIPFGFLEPRSGGLIRVRGRLVTTGNVDVAHGSNWYVAPGALLEIGGGTFFSPGTRVVAMQRISVGERCAIGWETQILDDNHHPITFDGRERGPDGTVTIGEHVWIASRVTILKDTVIGDGCVVAAGSVVKGDFSEPGCLIAGTPAKVIRRDVTWRFERGPLLPGAGGFVAGAPRNPSEPELLPA